MFDCSCSSSARCRSARGCLIDRWYPAPGARGYANGTLSAAGYYGYSWASSIPASSAGAHNLAFGDSWLNLQNSSRRTYGFQVRCLQE